MTGAKLFRALCALTARDLRIAYRRRGEAANPVIFFLIVTVLFTISIGPTPAQLQSAAPGLIWVTALLSTLLGLETLFRSDYEDGSLEQMVISPYPLSLLAFAKVAAHWLITGLPLVILSPVIGMMLHLDYATIKTLIISLLLGTPILSLIGAIGAALTVGLKRGGLLIALLILPLYIPVLIFGANAVQAVIYGLSPLAQLYALGSILALFLVATPIAISGALRASLN